MTSIHRVQVEHYTSPLGIGESSPRLSWRFQGDSRDWVQASYDVRITSSNGQTREYHIGSPNSILEPWPSTPLKSREAVKVEIRSNGSGGDSTEWGGLEVEAGLIDRKDWSAQMISSEEQTLDKPKKPFRVRNVFDISRVGRARLYITAHGLYEAYINGQRIGNEYLSPGWTDYNYHLNYRVFDVTHLLKQGTNVLGAWVGEGWYAGRLGYTGECARNRYGSRPGLFAQLEVDGRVVAATGKGWSWAYGALKSSELYDGEIYNTNGKEGWTDEQGAWQDAEIVDPPKAQLLSAQNPPIRAVETIEPVEIITSSSGKIIVDFGQNFAGIVKLIGEPPSSGQLVLRYAEVLEHGELGVRPLRVCAAIDTIILGGRSAKGYEPKFTSHGFRYAEVTGWDNISTADVVGIVLQSAMERTGHFECSHPLINQLHKNVVYSTISNTISIPTDCPQRDERLGWTGDIQVFTPTLSYLFDSSGFLKDWFKDLYVDQKELNGIVPVVIPNILKSSVANAPFAIWGDVAVITPHDMYQAYGDRQILLDQYESMQLWLEQGVVRDPATGLWSRAIPQLSDWLHPKADPAAPADGPTDNHLVADAWLIHTCRVFSKVSAILGKQEIADRYSKQVETMIESFWDEYITRNGRVISDTQTALASILHFNLFPISASSSSSGRAGKQVFIDRLGELVSADMWKVSTGFAGTPIILHALRDAGLSHHAYRMLQGKTSPSWLSPILLGATTIWERWDSMLADGSINPGEMTSFNHYALGSVASFLHAVVGGLSPLQPGWREILIRPEPGGTINSAKTSFLSPLGMVSCDWHIQNEETLFVTVSVPPNARAKVVLPGGVEEWVGSGKRDYKVKWEKDPRFPPVPPKPVFAKPAPDEWIA
ncbi:hypothetical protein I316_06258 [Kwoniella heveanensis BCC8398]|uniref:alpha-L-rhamnosidase n=1 Tax=Kwoniella heveanensis BCC8398 TaxID=1296120 RepID=A0A1B9GM59_9TREE|nr:hypothetical protein I316_06258 [Kwoniella heveanensis BCC8398]